ncbi:ABC transporter substrate-binding protein [Terrihabitans soli]|uniref:ABC transporter substrate-binding protein n=1 Tax=Terrihabitans soli TaxID=708113 RepID=A0A6S6QY88_9HYPH|nr:extracellular solute-binding protein [Terrihabitans soli]BCJ92020.1 ABC transporter substrate-binding protein [Terrihabitans soli]
MIADRLAAALLAFCLLTPPAFAEDAWVHGLALNGTVKYPPGFAHFDYVNPNAPKGGTLRLSAIGTYDSFNTFIPRGSPAGGAGFIYETLMTAAADQPSSQYGLLAEAAKSPPDISSVTYRLRAGAKWHDGKPVTPEDVIFSLEALKAAHPRYAGYYRNVVKAEKTGERDVTFSFDQTGNRELPYIVGELTVLPKHYWEGTDATGTKRDLTKTTLEAPLGSGPYRIKPGFQPGRTLTLERVPDYWGKDIPVRSGTNNFDEVQFTYYRDAVVALEAFKADQYDFRQENIAKNWATAYDFPARRDGKVVLETHPIRSSGVMQAFSFNTRRAKFQDPRVRRAFDLALNFDDMNRSLFFGQYKRIESYFQNTELASSGLPQGRELEILNEVKGEVPPEVFTTPYKSPQTPTPEALRDNLREALKLLGEAGWTIKENGGKRALANAAGETMKVEFLLDGPTFERAVLSYKPNLERLGIEVSVRTVDASQYENRMRAFDFDMTTDGWGQSLSPGNEQRDLWGSAAADREGSQNTIGIKNPAIDKLIDKVIYAKDREELVAATHALDRVLLWNHYVVPQWTTPEYRFAYWKRLAHPEKLPEYGLDFPDVWWSADAKPPTP